MKFWSFINLHWGHVRSHKKFWARSVQPFWRLLDTDKQTDRQDLLIIVSMPPKSNIQNAYQESNQNAYNSFNLQCFYLFLKKWVIIFNNTWNLCWKPKLSLNRFLVISFTEGNQLFLRLKETLSPALSIEKQWVIFRLVPQTKD